MSDNLFSFIFGIIIGMLLIVVLALIFGEDPEPEPEFEIVESSWYSRAECISEKNPNALMANTEPLNDNALTCAHWDYDFGTFLKVTHVGNGKSVIVKVCDRGPAKRLYKKGRKIDLTREAFSRLEKLSVGIIPVRIEVVK